MDEIQERYNDVSDSDDEYYDELCENIINLFHDLKSRFPYFLGTRAENLYNFILKKKSNIEIPKHFIKENRKEIDVTYEVINKFLTSYKMYVKEIDWIRFCYTESLLI
jgi:hypothetical protein